VPDSFEQLSYVKSNYIITGNTGRGKQKRSGPSYGHSKKNAGFEELKTMSNSYRWKILDGYSLKELEALVLFRTPPFPGRGSRQGNCQKYNAQTVLAVEPEIQMDGGKYPPHCRGERRTGLSFWHRV
jgi:hypothetical protein